VRVCFTGNLIERGVFKGSVALSAGCGSARGYRDGVAYVIWRWWWSLWVEEGGEDRPTGRRDSYGGEIFHLSVLGSRGERRTGWG